jgi:hypothetical protein
MKKTYQEIFDFIEPAYNHVHKEENKNTKMAYSIKKMIGDAKFKKPGRLTDAISKYYEKLEDIANELASTDEKKNIIIDPNGNKVYTAEKLKQKRDQEKQLLKEEVEFEPYFSTEIPELTEVEQHFFSGFVIPEKAEE